MHHGCVALLFLALTTPVAGAPSLALPIDCELGTTCYIQQYMDHDPSDMSQDFQCGPRTYDTHKGTDFAVPTAAIAKTGISILAAAAGTVLGTRDGMRDIWSGDFDAESIKGRDCGNGLVIDHGEGWHTQYCHMREGSVAVSKGQSVDAGTRLGQMGMSGRTQFPHLHLSVRKDGEPVDPFATNGPNCDGAALDSLWQDLPLFQPGGIMDLGFSDQVPDYTDIKLGVASTKITRVSPAIVGYFYMFGAKSGDEIKMNLTGPGDFKVNDTYTLDKDRAQFFRAIGKKRRSAPWPGGLYTATATFLRGGEIIDQRSGTFEIQR